MSRARRTVIAAAVALAALVTLLSSGPAAASGDAGHDRSNVVATFEGSVIHLADGWGEAQACASDDGRTARCYRSEAEMDAVEAESAVPGWSRGGIARAACSGPLRLYRAANYGGSVLQLSVQGQYINLAGYGFDNDTSSYRIGPCGARFYDTATGGGLYPGSTTAGASSPTMAAGWDNRISSIRIL